MAVRLRRLGSFRLLAVREIGIAVRNAMLVLLTLAAVAVATFARGAQR